MWYCPHANSPFMYNRHYVGVGTFQFSASCAQAPTCINRWSPININLGIFEVSGFGFTNASSWWTLMIGGSIRSLHTIGHGRWTWSFHSFIFGALAGKDFALIRSIGLRAGSRFVANWTWWWLLGCRWLRYGCLLIWVRVCGSVGRHC